MENKQGGSRENAGRKRTQNIRVFLTVSPETEKALKKFKERWQRQFPKSKTGYVSEIDARLYSSLSRSDWSGFFISTIFKLFLILCNFLEVVTFI